MERIMVTYKVKADRVVENEELIKGVYEELRQINDMDIHYVTFKLSDGQTFVHLASFASLDKQPVLIESKAFKAFQENLKDRCEMPPDPQKLDVVDSYNFV